MSDRTGFRVAAYNPFWRYAVALWDRPDLAAIPFTRKSAALCCLDQMCAELPSSRPVLLRRLLLGRVDVVSERGAR